MAAWCCSNGLSVAACGLAIGTNFPDSLAASALLGRRGNPLLLAAPGHTGAAAKVVGGGTAQVTVLGGEGALPTSVANEVAGVKQESPSSSLQLRYGRELYTGYPYYNHWHTMVVKPGATEIPLTLADYRATYGLSDSDVRYGGKFAILAYQLSIPDTKLKVGYESLSVNDERYATAASVYGPLGDLVGGLGTSRIGVRDLAARIEAPYQFWSSMKSDVEVCGSCALSYRQGSNQAYIAVPMDSCDDPNGYFAWGRSEIIGIYVDVAADGTVSSQSNASFHVMMWG